MSFLQVISSLLVLLTTVDAIICPNESKLRFYYGPEYDLSSSYELTDAVKVLQHDYFTNDETHFVINGYDEPGEYGDIPILRSAYAKRKTINLLVLEWRRAATQEYITDSILNFDMVLGNMVLNWFDSGLKQETLTIVGHALGALLAGMTARNVAERSDGTVKIYNMVVLDALDPVYLNHSTNSILVRKDDVGFLQAIHASIVLHGPPTPLGHVDFWPDGGPSVSPKCRFGFLPALGKDDLCNHQKSLKLWAESIIPGGKPFWAFPAKSYSEFLAMGIGPLRNRAIRMGYGCPKSARGFYFLNTNRLPPFAKGFDGY